jgi:cytochrome oxidase assembly protein ShyY1
VYRFLLRPRWLGLLLVVVALAAVCVRLGLWQLERFNERQAANARITSYLDAEPVPVDEVAGVGVAVPQSQEWRRVVATGRYDPDAEVLVRYQSRDGRRGVDVVTPLVTGDGTAILVDRGWMPGDAPSPAEVPDPPTGSVTVTGWLRADSGAGASATRPAEGQVRAISSAGIATTVDYPLYRGYIALTDQSPGETQLAPAPPPDLGQGPHFFYGLQWFFFAGLAVFGWCYFAWVEAHPRRRPGVTSPSPRAPAAVP